MFYQVSNVNIQSTLSELVDFYTQNGLIEGLLIAGSKSDLLIQNFIDNSNDVTIAYMLSKLFNPFSKSFIKIETEFFQIMNKLSLFEERIRISSNLEDIARKLHDLPEKPNLYEGLVLSCFFCAKPVIQQAKKEIQSKSAWKITKEISTKV